MVDWLLPNVTSYYSLFGNPNTASEGIFGILLFISIYVIPYIYLSSKTKSSDALLTTSFFGLVFVSLFAVLGAIYPYMVIYSVIGVVLAVVISMLGGRN